MRGGMAFGGRRPRGAGEARVRTGGEEEEGEELKGRVSVD